jgi:general secretion pathway protein F
MRVPPLGGHLAGWVRAGEASGDLAGLLDSAGIRCQQHWERVIARSLVVMEVALILLVGALVLLVAIAILLPIMSLNRSLG